MTARDKPAFSKAASLGDHAFALMKRLSMEINPVTFELVYEMVSGHNPELKQRFAELGRGMSRADLDALCRQFLPHHFGEAILERSYRTIRDELDHFQEDLNESRSTLSDFAGTLSTTSRALTGLKSPDIAPIRSQIDKVRSAASAHQAKAGQIIEKVEARMNAVNTLSAELDEIHRGKFRDPLTGLGNRRAFHKDMADYYKTDRMVRDYTLVLASYLNFQVFSQPELARMRNDFVQRMTETNAPLVDNLGRGYWLERPENAYLLETADPAEITRFTQALHETMTREIQVLRGSARNLPAVGIAFGCADSFSADSAAAVIRNAEAALVDAVRQGDGGMVIFGRREEAGRGRDYALYGRQSVMA